MLDLHNYNIHPAEDCEMFVIAAFTIIDVKFRRFNIKCVVHHLHICMTNVTH